MGGRLTLFMVLFFLSGFVFAAVECPSGFEFRPRSGVGCVQKDCFDRGGVWSYTQSCICITGYHACTEPVDYSGFSKDKCGPNCPYSRLIKCVEAGTECDDSEIVEDDLEVAESVLTPMKDGEVDNTVYSNTQKKEEDCSDYCGKQNPPRSSVSGFDYPNCRCECENGEGWVIPLGCKKCTEVCTRPEMGLAKWTGGECECFCTDALKKWDKDTQRCVDGSTCNGNGVCEVRLEENCECGDCTCYFEGDSSFMNKYVKCEPSSKDSDAIGCAYEDVDDEELLKVLKKEYQECTTAWVMKAMGSMGEYDKYKRGAFGGDYEQMAASSAATSTGRIPGSQMKWETMGVVGKWIAKSGCGSFETGDDRIVPGRQDATADPAVCLAEYCQQTIWTPYAQIAKRHYEKTGINYNPTMGELAKYWWNRIMPSGGFKIPTASSGPGVTPKEHFNLMGGNLINMYGDGKVYGNKEGFVTNSNRGFLVIAESEYLVENLPDLSNIYLFEGKITYYYQKGEDIASEILAPGEMLKVDDEGQIIEKISFKKEELENWWDDEPYLEIDCPKNSKMVGPDCMCNVGYLPDFGSGQCVKATTQADSNVNMPDIGAGTIFTAGAGLLATLMLAWLVLVILLIIVLLKNRKKKKKDDEKDTELET